MGTITANSDPEVLQRLQNQNSNYKADFEQSFQESSQWVVNHNLGHYPVYVLLDSGGVIMDGEVVNININQLTVSFKQPMNGTIRCI
jgi:hypothetical protein